MKKQKRLNGEVEMGTHKILGMSICLAELKGEVNQGQIFLDKCRYALLN